MPVCLGWNCIRVLPQRMGEFWPPRFSSELMASGLHRWQKSTGCFTLEGPWLKSSLYLLKITGGGGGGGVKHGEGPFRHLFRTRATAAASFPSSHA